MILRETLNQVTDVELKNSISNSKCALNENAKSMMIIFRGIEKGLKVDVGVAHPMPHGQEKTDWQIEHIYPQSDKSPGKKWLEDYITTEETINLLDKLNLNGETEINNIFDGFEKQRGKKLTDPVIRYLVTNHFDKSSYGDFGKDFAMFLLKNGYIGRKVEYCENGQDICYIVFDPSIIEIISKG